MSGKKLYDHRDVLLQLIVSLDEFSILPELYSWSEDIDPENPGRAFESLLCCFGGQNIHIPSQVEYNQLVRQVLVFCEVKNGSGEEKEIMNRVMKKYALFSTDGVRKIISSVERKLNQEKL